MADPMVRNSIGLIANTGVTSLLGLVFWIVAARSYSSENVGQDSALIAAMITLSSVAQLNLHNALLRFLPAFAGRSRAVLSYCYFANVLAALILGFGFIEIVPKFTKSLSFLVGSYTLEIMFVGAVALWGVFALQDAVITAIRRSLWIPLENGLFGVAKLLLLPVLAFSVHGILLACVIPMAFLVLPVNLLIYRAIGGPASLHQVAIRQSLPPRRNLLVFLAQDYVGSIANQLTLTVLPILVLSLLGDRANAHFYIPFTIVSAADSIALNISASYTVEAAHRPGELSRLTRDALIRCSAATVCAIAFLIVAAYPLLVVFGHEYARTGVSVMRLLALASPSRAMLVFYAAHCRLTGKGLRIIIVQAAQLILVVLSVPLFGSKDLLGVAVAWVVSSWAIAVPAAWDFWRSHNAPVVPRSQSLADLA
jgi:O-antigen/teichoic acid export membrane protein